MEGLLNGDLISGILIGLTQLRTEYFFGSPRVEQLMLLVRGRGILQYRADAMMVDPHFGLSWDLCWKLCGVYV